MKKRSIIVKIKQEFNSKRKSIQFLCTKQVQLYKDSKVTLHVLITQPLNFDF